MLSWERRDRKHVPDVFSVSVPDSTLSIPSMESYRLHSCRRRREFRTCSVQGLPLTMCESIHREGLINVKLEALAESVKKIPERHRTV